MNDFLQVFGSIASIASVPLAVYLYLKSQIEKYAKVRREIVKRMSHQIGEKRIVTRFELQAVINSLVRENRLSEDSITSDSIVEDLIAETISSPLLESSRKNALIVELEMVHSEGEREVDETAATNDGITTGELVDEKTEAEKERNPLDEARLKRSELKYKERLAHTFGAASFSIGAAAATATMIDFYADIKNDGAAISLPSWITDQNFLPSVLVGLGVALLSALIAGIVASRTPRK